jgi:hypothetical protein
MLAIGCIQAQRCHTGRCPTGVATQSARLARGLDPADKSVRVANYVATLRHELVRLARACGHRHPAAITPQQVELLRDGHRSATLGEIDDYGPGWGVPGPAVLGSFLAQWPGPVPLRVVEPAEEAGR